MGILDSAAVICFNLVLIIFTLPPYIIAKVGVLCAKLRPLRPESVRTRVVLAVTCLCWRAVFGLCFWIRVRTEGLREFRRTVGASGRPAVIVGNHSSFLDTLLLVTLMPVSHVVKTKMFVSAHLTKIPFLRTIVRAMGHIVVPFKAGVDANSFELDKELMVKRQQELEEHVRGGGVAGWFPEGRLNPGDTTVVGLFRAGGFALATHQDVEVWCVACLGNGVCWPAKAGVGGHPARIGIRLIKLCDSTWDMVSTSRGGPGLQDEAAATRFLANAAQARVQKTIDDLVSEGYVGQAEASSGGSGERPLLG